MLKNRKSISVVGVLALLLLATTAPAFSAHGKKSPVQLKSPSNIVVTPELDPFGSFTVSWSTVPNASSYTVRVYSAAGKTLVGDPISTLTLGLTVTKSPNTTYRVTVQAIVAGTHFSNSPESGKYSVATYPYSFTTAPTPTLCASPQVGLSCAAGVGTWSPSATLTYQWQISDDGSTSWTDIGSATSSSYTPVGGDLNKFLLVRVTGTYAGYTTTTRTSVASSAVVAGAFTTAPTPTLCASPQVGVSCAAATGGTWDPSATLAYQWQISNDGSTSWTDIGSATSSSYTPVGGDLNKFLLVRVTGTLAGYTTTTKDSVASSAVAAGASSSLITNGQFTIRFWVKPTTGFLNGQRKELVTLVTDNGTSRFDIWYSPTEGSDWAIYNNESETHWMVNFYDLDSPTPVIGNWYEVVVTRDASNKLHFYFDSVESSYQPVSTVDLSTYKNILIGADPASWNTPSASGQGDAFISNLQIINGVALTPTSDFASETARTTFRLKDFIGSNNSLVLTPTSYFAFSNGVLSSRPTGGTPVYSTELPVLAVGRTGQGRGTIFYYSAGGFACGPTLAATCHYLEYAPNGWAPNDLHDWINVGSDSGVRSTLMNDPLLLWSPDSVWVTGGGQPGFVTTSITAVDFTSATATYTSAGHTFRVGDKALIAGLDPVGYNGLFTITDVTSNTFTVANTTNLTVVDGIGTVKTNRKQIGAGRLNTLEIQTAGNNSNLKWAYNSVLQYSGGTRTDWYIPSVYELRELCKWANGQTTGDTTVACVAGTISSSFTQGSRHASGYYWSSNQSLDSDYRGVLLDFTNPLSSGVSGEAEFYYSSWSESIRPIRAF